MHQINFYHTIPVSATIVCLFFGLGVPIKIIKKIKCEAVDFNLNFIKNIVLLFVGILMLAAGLYGIFSYCNPHKTILITLTEFGILLPTETNASISKILIIPWKSITKIHLEDYYKWHCGRNYKWRYGMSYTMHSTHYAHLYFNYVDTSGKSSIASINSEFLGVPFFLFFANVRKFYSGPIYKKIGMEAGKLQVLKSSTDNQLMWEDS